jgi:pyruvyltransferase
METLDTYWWRPLLNRPANSFAVEAMETMSGRSTIGFRNFGDELSPLILQGLTQSEINRVSRFRSRKLLALGSIIWAAKPGDEVWGSGLLGHERRLNLGGVKFHGVRGPKTRDRLLAMGAVVPEVFGDPALLLPEFCKPVTEKKYRLGVVPHFSQFFAAKKLMPPDDNVLLIDVKKSAPAVVEDIASCELICASSLHGLIVADALQIPNAWVTFTKLSEDGAFKFEDYYAAAKVRHVPLEIRATEQLGLAEKAAKGRRPAAIDLAPLRRSFPYGTRG